MGAATVAIHALCFAIFNQYLVTTNSVRFRQYLTRRRAVALSILLYLYSTLLLGPNLCHYTHIINSLNQTMCNVKNPVVAVYNVYNSVVIYTAIPMFILTLFLLLIWRNLQNQSRQRRLSLKRAIALTLFAQILMVLIAAAAFCTRRIYILYTTDVRKSSIRLAQDRIITNVSTLFGLSIHGFSFFIYWAISKTFRGKVSHLFVCQHQGVEVNIVRGTRR